MPIHYFCRHCSAKMGMIEDQNLKLEQLGIHMLTAEEKQEMISYTSNGDTYIRAICEDCQEAYTQNPDLHQYDYLIH